MIIKVRVKPNSEQSCIEKLDDFNYVIKTKEKAINGKANLEVIKMLSKFFDVSFKSMKIKNPKSRNKIIEIVK